MGESYLLKLMERVQKLYWHPLSRWKKPMTKEKEVTVEIRQAESADAALVVDFLNHLLVSAKFARFAASFAKN